MSPETGDQTVLERLPQLTEMLTEPIYPSQPPNELANAADVAFKDPDDSEAETERLHLSPTKKRLATEIELENIRKRAKLAGRDCPIALSEPTADTESPMLPKSTPTNFGTEPPVKPEPNDDEIDTDDGTRLLNPLKPNEEADGEADHQTSNDEAIPDKIVSDVLDHDEAQHDDASHDESHRDDASHDETGPEKPYHDKASPNHSLPNELHHKEAHEEEVDHEAETVENRLEIERLQAIKSLSEIEATLSQVCDRLHEQQLMKFDLEIKMCSEGTHPSLRQYRDRINGELEEKLTRIGNLLCYQMNSIHAESRAGRCAAMQTYMKNRFQLRTEMLNAVTERWYKTNRERQQMMMGVPEFGYAASGVPRNVRRTPVPKMGVKTHHTLLKMPAAPSMPYLTDAERDEDLRSLGLR